MSARLAFATVGLGLAGTVLVPWTSVTPSAATLALVWGLLVITAIAPQHGLALTVAVIPMSTAIAVVLGPHWFGFGLTEASCLALVGGWGLHEALSVARGRHRAPPQQSWLPVTPLLAWATAVAIAGGAALVSRSVMPAWPTVDYLESAALGDTWRTTLQMLTLSFAGLTALLICRTHRAAVPVTVAAMTGIAGAALLNVNRLAEVALRSETPGNRFVEVFGTLRVNTSFSDLNAAGSWFALAAITAGALAFMNVRRWPMGVCSLLAAAGLATTGSRSAMAALGLTACVGAAGVLLSRSTRWRWILAIGGLLVLVAAGYGIYRRGDPSYHMQYRMFMTRTALAMIASAPVVGVGPGLYASRSVEFMPEPAYPWWISPENAHNNYLQIAAETGLVGVLAICGVMLGLLIAARHSGASDDGRAVRAVTLGLTAFLITCLGGHPLLVVPVAAMFWILVGVSLGASEVGRYPTPEP